MSRRALGGLVGLGAVGAGVGTAAYVGHDEEPFRPRPTVRPARRPNLLVILADDMGWGDLSCYGAPTIRTPHLDRLAASGLRFTDGYAGSSVCSPTRIALYTGRYPGRLRGGLEEPIGPPGKEIGIPAGHPTLASLLKGVGYDTAMIGKWHCGYLPWFSPTRVGWDSFFGNFSGGLDYFSKVNFLGDHDLYEDEVEVEDLRYYTHVLAERAIEEIRRPHERPWLLNLNFTSPHWPWEGPDDRAVSKRLTPDAGSGALFHQDGGSLEVYGSMVEDLDDSVGRVLAALDASGARRQTLVFFASDNGGERFSYSWPFSGGKYDLYEGGIRVPTLLSWPGVLPAHKVSDAPVVTMDWTATFLELVGARPAAGHPLDGASMASYLFDGGAPPDRDLFWRMRDQRALRRGDLKYYQDSGGEDHLFDLSADVHEQADLAEDRPHVLGSLRAAWQAVDADLLPYRS